MFPQPCSKPCPGCPFRRKSAQGYLGGYATADDFIDVHYRNENIAPCHTSVDYERPDWLEAWQRGENGLSCAGQRRLFVNSYKRPRNPYLSLDGIERDEEVFGFAHEFIEHHDAC